VNYGPLEGATFRKARGCADKNCVEVAGTDGIIGVRDSAIGQRGPLVTFTTDKWSAFLEGAKKGEFDLP